MHKERQGNNQCICLSLFYTFKQCLFVSLLLRQCPVLCLALQLLKSVPFSEPQSLSPASKIYNLPFPKDNQCFEPVFTFPDFFVFQRVYLSVIYLYMCVTKIGNKNIFVSTYVFVLFFKLHVSSQNFLFI